MSQPIKNATAVHVIVPPNGTQNYHAVVHADSGREVVRCPDAASAVLEQTRLNRLDTH